MNVSSLHSSESSDSNLEYHVGLFIASDVQKAAKATTRKKPTTPDPFRFVTSERYGERSYSVSASQRRHSSAPRARSITPNSLRNSRPPKLTLTTKRGDRIYSTSTLSQGSIGSLDQEDSIGTRKRASGAPKLRLTEKFGNRVYSSFADDSLDRYSNQRSSSKPRHTNARPPKLALNDRLGERHYSLFANNSSDTYDRPSISRKNMHPPKLRLLERHGERHYSSTSSPHKEIPSSRSWSGPRRLTLTVPVPFHLSSSPEKFSKRAQQYKQPTFQFRALPMPSFAKMSLPTNTMKQSVHTVPDPFHLSKTNYGERVKTPPTTRKRRAIQQTSINVRRRGNKLLQKIPSKTSRKSIKSKHRFSIKHQGKVFRNFGIVTENSTGLGSVNPNLNASRAAREKYLRKVAAEVAKLREEWQRYKEEAQRISDDLKKAKQYRKKLQKKILLVSKRENANNNIEFMKKQLAQLDKIVGIKSQLLQEYEIKLKENEERQSALHQDSRRIKNQNNMKERRPLLIYGRQRSIRRVMSLKNFSKSNSSERSIRIHKNNSLTQNHDGHGGQDFFNHRRDIDHTTEPNLIEPHVINEQISPEQSVMQNFDSSDKIKLIKQSKEQLSEVADEVEEERVDEKSREIESSEKTSGDDSTEVDTFDPIASRDDDFNTSSQNAGEVQSIKTEVTIQECRPKGDFGDDFAVPTLTTMFRGGWQRALKNEHLANPFTDKKNLVNEGFKSNE